MFKKISFILILFVTGIIYAEDIILQIEDKYFVIYSKMDDKEKGKLLDALAEDVNSRILSSPTTNYLFFEIHENESNRNKLNDLRDTRKIEKYKQQVLKQKDGNIVVETEEYIPFPLDWEIHISSKD